MDRVFLRVRVARGVGGRRGCVRELTPDRETCRGATERPSADRHTTTTAA